MSSPGPFGNSFADALRHYLSTNGLKQSQLTHGIVAELADRHYTHYEAQKKARKKSGDASPEDSALYAAYPRKIGRMDALAAIRGARESHPSTDFLGRVQEFARAVARWPQNYRYKDGRDTVPYPATWFRAGRYCDDPKEWLPAGMFQREDDPIRGQPERAAVLLEPQGWREEFPDFIHLDRQWADITQDHKKAICEHMQKMRVRVE